MKSKKMMVIVVLIGAILIVYKLKKGDIEVKNIPPVSVEKKKAIQTEKKVLVKITETEHPLAAKPVNESHPLLAELAGSIGVKWKNPQKCLI